MTGFFPVFLTIASSILGGRARRTVSKDAQANNRGGGLPTGLPTGYRRLLLLKILLNNHPLSIRTRAGHANVC
jgi:hypothetical protein